MKPKSFWAITDENREAILNAMRSLFLLAVVLLFLSSVWWWAGPLSIVLMIAGGSWLYIRCALADTARRC